MVEMYSHSATGPELCFFQVKFVKILWDSVNSTMFGIFF